MLVADWMCVFSRRGLCGRSEGTFTGCAVTHPDCSSDKSPAGAYN